MLNSGRRGSRAPDGFGILSVNEQFNQTNYPIPVINSWAITNGSYVPIDDTALDTAGGQTVVVYGSGFKAGVTVNINGSNVSPVVLLDSGRITFTSPALSSASYTMYVSNTDGATAIYVPGLVYSGVPNWSSPSAGSIGTSYETKSVSTLSYTSFSASGDAPITYSILSGSLPSGVTLSSSGTLSGSLPVASSPTTYSFTIRATDAQNQDSDRSFSLTINPDVVSWVNPTLNGSLTVYETQPFSTPLSATSAAGYGVMYSANALPTGITLNSSTGAFTGYANVVGTTYSTLTATANTTGRSTTSTSSFVVNQDSVAWVSPANNTSYALAVGTSNTVTLTASSAAGYGVMFTANTLPTGLSLNTSTGQISGTPTTTQTINTQITATANTSNRVDYRYIYWSVSISADVYFANTVMLLSANTSNFYGTNTFATDNSNNLTQLTIVGDTRADSFNPYQSGYYSNYFSGGALWMLTAFTTLMTGDWTVECWIYLPTALTSTYVGLLGQTNGSGNALYHCWELNNAGCRLLTADGNTYNTINYATAAPVPGQWHHVAWSNSGTTNKFYLNGVYQGSVSQGASAWTSAGGYTMVGRAAGDTYTGYISNMRVVNGAALYTTTGSFTVPTGPLTTNVSSGTTLFLSCQSNRFVDNSQNNYAYDPTSTFPLVKPNNPFGTPYVANTQYYSTYFNGTSDYLSLQNTSLFNNLSGTTFTLEFWMYPTSYAAGTAGYEARTIFSTGQTYPNGFRIELLTSSICFYDYVGSTRFSYAVSLNVWTHVAFTYSGNTVKMYLNGILVATANSATWNNSTVAPIIGASKIPSYDYYYAGYLSNIRMSMSVLYTGNFTPPTSPLTITSVGTSGANVAGSLTSSSVLLLTCKDSTFIDNSSNNLTITANTATVKPLAVSPFTPTGYTNTQITNYGSAYFDGSGDYLLIPETSIPEIGSNDFTIEGWIYPLSNASNTYYCWVGKMPDNSYGTFYFPQYNGNLKIFMSYAGSSWNIHGTNSSYNFGALTLNAWNHFALSRSGTNIRGFINGVLGSTVTVSAGQSFVNNSNPISLGAQSAGTEPAKGYMSDFRFTPGVALYTSNFVPQFTNPLSAIANTAVLTCQSNGPHNNNNFVDSSNNIFAISRVNNVTQGTFTPFSPTGWSVYSDNRSYLQFPQNSNYDLIGTDFTIEFWFNPVAFNGMVYSGSNILGNALNSGSSGGWFVTFDGTGTTVTTLSYQVYNGGWTANSFAVSIPFGTWVHVAFVRNGSGAGNMKLYVNGVQQGVAQNQVTYVAAGGAITAGSGAYTQNPTYSGSAALYISNFRISKSVVYSSAFTPPTSQLTTSTSPIFLAFQDNRLLNNGSVGGTGTNNTYGALYASIQPYSPFATTAVYSPVTHGGSAYFGSAQTDYLTSPASSAIALVGNNWTVEAWVYPIAYGTYNFIYDRASGTPNASTEIELSISSVGALVAGVYVGGTGYSQSSGSGTVIPGQWNHVAATRNGTTVNTFVNGVAGTTPPTVAGSLNDPSSTPLIGGQIVSGRGLYGYMGGFRLVNGTALYTSNYTVPNTPFTAIANTQLLLTYTNTGIIDNTHKNDLQTVGDVKVTRFSPYSANNYGVLFNGSSDYFYPPSNATWNPSTNDFCIEAWAYFSTTDGDTNYRTIMSNYSGGGYIFGLYNSGTPHALWYDPGIATNLQGATTILPCTWYHIAVTRVSGNIRIFLNGKLDAYATGSTYAFGGATPNIGKIPSASQTGYMLGYISNLRCTANSIPSAYSTASTTVGTQIFTPSTSSLTTTSQGVTSANVTLLTCQSNKFIDNSTNGYALTLGGTPKVATNNPFTINAGQSYYYDGTGDYLMSSNIAPKLEGDFTIEGWVYRVSANFTLACLGDDYTSTGINVYWSSGNNAWNVGTNNGSRINGPSYTTTNEWKHVAVVRQSGTIKLYIDGVQQGGSYSNSTVFTGTLYIGGELYNSTMYTTTNGYMSDVRITKYARYTSNNTTYLNSGTPYLLR